MSITTEALAARLTSPPGEKRIPAEPGFWIIIIGDMSMFALFFTVYAVYRGKQPALFDRSQDVLNKDLGAINTLVLLVSSLFIVMAVRAMRTARRDLAQRLIVGAFACGLVFIAIKVFEYHERVAAHETPVSNNFFMMYFILTGLHLFHLCLGLAVLSILRYLAGKPELSKNQWALFEGGACFWHMVDLLWFVIFPLVYLVR
ncbi:cytochrome c oxidase subunit 3 [Nocardia sp. NPDC059246]|uniref:cytochrome c oxidase subunit 3 n=1 Tax=unclassified Nocardia TaxID=2637762 RepID=UPI00369E90FB